MGSVRVEVIWVRGVILFFSFGFIFLVMGFGYERGLNVVEVFGGVVVDVGV